MVRALFVLVAGVVLAVAGVHAEQDKGEQQVAVDTGSDHVLRGSTGLVNKNVVAKDNNVAITRSNVLARQDDTITLEAQDVLEADDDKTVPAEVMLTGEKEELRVPAGQEYYGGGYYGHGDGYRHRFYYPYGGGYRYGWRYPMPYWNYYGRHFYGSGCGYGRGYGGYYYC